MNEFTRPFLVTDAQKIVFLVFGVLADKVDVERILRDIDARILIHVVVRKRDAVGLDVAPAARKLGRFEEKRHALEGTRNTFNGLAAHRYGHFLECIDISQSGPPV